MQIVRNEKAENSPVIISANHHRGAMGGAMANRPSMEPASTSDPTDDRQRPLAAQPLRQPAQCGVLHHVEQTQREQHPANAVRPTP